MHWGQAINATETLPALATERCMAGKLCGRARAELHTMLTEETFGADVIAMRSRPARITDTFSIVLAAPRLIFALAILATARTIRTISTGNIAIGAHPTGRTLTLTADMIAFSTIFTCTILAAMQSIFTIRTRMLARKTYVARTAHVITAYMVASLCISIDNIGTLLLAAQTVAALRAWFRAIVTRPAFVTDALARLRIAR